MTERVVFVISPIGAPGTEKHDRYRLTLDYVVKKAFTPPEWSVVRADDEAAPDSISNRVIRRIIESDLIVADLTDHNPNVFYELAVAHGYRRPVVHLIEDGQKPPFDVGDQRMIFYNLRDPRSVDASIDALRAAADWLEREPDSAQNPLSAFDRFTTIGSGGSDASEAIAEALERLSSKVAAVQAQVAKRDSPRAAAAGLVRHGWTSNSRIESVEHELSHLAALRARGEDVGEAMEQLYIHRAELLDQAADEAAGEAERWTSV